MFTFTDNNILTAAQLNSNFGSVLDKVIGSPQTVAAPVSFSGGLSSTSFAATGTATFSGAQVDGITVFTSSGNYTVTATDRFILVNKAVGSATQVILPALVSTGRRLTVKDAKGDAGSNAITVLSAGTDNLDGASNAVIGTNYGSLDLIYSGTGWAII